MSSESYPKIENLNELSIKLSLFRNESIKLNKIRFKITSLKDSLKNGNINYAQFLLIKKQYDNQLYTKNKSITKLIKSSPTIYGFLRKKKYIMS